MNKKRLFGLLGRNITHSFSPGYFNDKFKKEKIPAEYKLFDLPEASMILDFVPRLEGFNVTIPYKQEVFSFLDEVDKTAEKIGAVNVVKVTKKNNRSRLTGYNTDAIGFKRSLQPLLNKNTPVAALILGTGGASKAVAYVLSELKIPFTYVSRQPSQENLSYEQLDQKVISSHLLIINTTPLGMAPKIDLFPNIPYQHLSKDHILYDLIYNPMETQFLKKGKQMGATVKNGLEMLYLQADAAWEIWNQK